MKIRIHPSFWFYLGSIALLSSPIQSLSACAALCVHELSHWVVAYVVGERISLMEITPFGGVMTLERGHSSQKGLKGAAVAAAGPLGNYLSILLLGAVGQTRPLFVDPILYQLIAANLAMMLLNLLPALPLDGGRILFCIGYYLCSVSKLISALSTLGAVLGAGFICAGLHGVLTYGSLNLSLMIVGGYLIVYAKSSRASSLSENLYTVVQERLACQRDAAELRFYAVSPDIPLYELLALIDRAPCAAFVIEHPEGIQMIGEKEILYGLLKEPTAKISELETKRRCEKPC